MRDLDLLRRMAYRRSVCNSCRHRIERGVFGLGKATECRVGVKPLKLLAGLPHVS
jgi:hypothetical protein